MPRLLDLGLARSVLMLTAILAGQHSQSLLVFAQAENSSPTAQVSQPVDLLRIVVLDVSGSMSEDDGTGLSRLDTARRELLQSIESLPAGPTTPVVVIPFCDDVPKGSVRAYTTNAQLQEASARLKADGSTNIAAGLREAIYQINSVGQARNLIIFLYSDGLHNVGSIDLVYEQEDKLDKLFGQRAIAGLSQTVVVKRWGGVNGDLVARLQGKPHVKVLDAGQLELRTVTLVPAAVVKDLRWQDAAGGLAVVRLEAAVNNPSGQSLPTQTSVEISCPLAGCQWLSKPYLPVSRPPQTISLELLARLNSNEFNPATSYALPLDFRGPTFFRTQRGMIFVMINPGRIICPLPTQQLKPTVRIQASLKPQGKPQWVDIAKCGAGWSMLLRVEPTATPAVNWSEPITWQVKGLDGVQAQLVKPLVLNNGPQEVMVNLTKELSAQELGAGKPITVRIELIAISPPKTVSLADDRLQIAAQVDLPPAGITRISQRVSQIGQPVWSSLTAGLVTVPVTLEVTIDGLLSPGATLGLVPCKDIVAVEGIPVRVHSGSQTVQLQLTGRVPAAGGQVSWPLQLEPPPPAYGIRYTPCNAVAVAFTAPAPLQVVLNNDGHIFSTRSYRGADRGQAVLGQGVVQVIGGPTTASATAGLLARGELQGQLTGTGFSRAAAGNPVNWSMRPADTAVSKWWRDVHVPGRLLVLPENAAPGVVQGCRLDLSLTYEARYKKVVFYLALGLGAVLVGSILFWLVRMCVADGIPTRSHSASVLECGDGDSNVPVA